MTRKDQKTGESGRLPPPKWDIQTTAWAEPAVFSPEQRREIGNIFEIDGNALDRLVAELSDCIGKAHIISKTSKTLPTVKQLEAGAHEIHSRAEALRLRLESPEIGGIRADLIEALMLEQGVRRPDLFLEDVAEKLTVLELAAKNVSRKTFDKLAAGTNNTRCRRILARFIAKLMQDSLGIRPTISTDEDGDPPRHGKFAKTLIVCMEVAALPPCEHLKADLKLAIKDLPER